MWKCATTKSVSDSGHTHRGITEKEPCHPTVNKEQQEGDREQHRNGEVDIALPERQHPVIDLERVGTAMIRVVVAKKKPKYGFIPLTYMW
jgi:hypothetical protein